MVLQNIIGLIMEFASSFKINKIYESNYKILYIIDVKLQVKYKN